MTCCHRPLSECLAASCHGNATERCGGAGRLLVYTFKCTVTPPPPLPPPPPPREVPYWIVKNSWGPGYGDGGYLLMERGVGGSAGLCCIACQPQYIIATRGPAPPPAPPPVPPARCSAAATGQIGCFNITQHASLLPVEEGEFHDRLTLENCASQCFFYKHPVAGVDAGNHCRCGNLTDLAVAHGKLSRPMSECEASTCTGDKLEPCGGPGRMLAFEVNCTPG